jgi:hypothetical protein
MRIAIANVSKGISTSDFKTVVHAVERQVREDFAPAWGMTASLRMLRIDRSQPVDPEASLSDVVIYVGELGADPKAVENAVGYHTDNLQGIPYGFVFVDVAEKIGEKWSTTLSHEVLELIADPDVNLLVIGPDPKRANRQVLRPYEVCDPVQGDSYSIDGVDVSNFVTPLYFADLPHPTITRTNYLALPLDRFGVRPSGYFSYLDLTTGRYDNVFGDAIRGPEVAKKKAALGSARRLVRRERALVALMPGKPDPSAKSATTR